MCSINCRDIVKDAESRIARAAEERDEELAEKVRKATFEQLHSKFNSDLEILKKRIPTRDQEAAEAAKDVKYIRERQACLSD